MSFPIVNTPFARDSVAARYLHSFSTWNSAPSEDGRELPPYPRHYPGPWLGPLSFVARHSPVSPPCTVGLVGTSALVEIRRSDEQHFPVPMAPHAFKTDSVIRPTGLSFTVDDPTRRSHHPRAFAPRVNNATRLQLTVPTRFAFADPLDLPTRRIESLLVDHSVFRGLPTLQQATCRTLW